jgi:hypothetical protein
VDDGQLVLKAHNELVLPRREASITLTRTGKLRIRGSYDLSRSSGMNHIQGGAMEID